MDDTLYKNLINSTQELENMCKLLSNIDGELKKINETCREQSKNPISNIIGDVSNAISAVQDLKDIGNHLSGIAQAGGALAPVLMNLGTIISNVAPYLSLIAVVTGVVTVIGSLITGTDEAADKTDKYVEKLNKKREALRENTEELKKNSQSMIENTKSIQTDYGFTLRQVDELVKLTGEGGYATNLEKAKYLVEQINDVLPNSVSITEDGKIAWKDNTKNVQENADAIKAGIKELERRAILESYEKDAAEALKNRAEYQAKLTAAEKDYNDAVNAVAAAEERYQKAKNGNGINARKYEEEVAKANKKLEEQEKILYDTQSQFAANEKMINMCSYSYESLDGNIDATAKLHAELYTKIGERGTSSWKSLGEALVDLDRQYDEHLKNGLDDSSEEIELNTKTIDLIRQQCFDKAAAFDKSFDEMIQTLEKKGVTLTEEELEEWKKQYSNYEQNIKNKEKLQKLGFDNMLTQLVENSDAFNEKEQEILNKEILNWVGNATTKEEIQALNTETLLTKLKESGIELNSTQEGILNEQCEIWKNKGIEKIQIFDDTISTLNNELSDGYSNMNEQTRSRLTDMITILRDSGIEGGVELCQKLAKSLDDNDGKVTDETKEIINEMEGLVLGAKLKLVFGAEGPGEKAILDMITIAKGKVESLKLPLGMNAVISVAIKSLENKVKNGKEFANGGFPDTGELFIAREAGPELVGRINGKTAVANNDQIVSGISSGVYNAMVSAMSRNHHANTTVTAIFQVDGKQVAKQVINAHNREVMQTGRSPLLI
ncbi:hypothetical protein [Thomasclavelia cocleata]|uniref:hypothetical protein n=1 Tax=Thomasclavelia cocleata TaxID=69824 RepID=UPI0025581DA6|nr:hypothetical protein [Thomasclavelia cocleata]